MANKTAVIRAQQHDYTPAIVHARRLPSPMGHLIQQVKQTGPRMQISTSPDAESGPQAQSPSRPTLISVSGDFSASLELGLSYLLHHEYHGRPLRRL